jgi:hypothetical protein
MRRPVKVLLAAAAASVAAISVGTAGWAATSTPQPVVLMTPPVLNALRRVRSVRTYAHIALGRTVRIT